MNQGMITTNSLRSSNIEEVELVTDYGLDALAAVLHETAVSKGFWEGEINYDKVGNKLALVHSEVTEVLEAIRKNKGSEEVVEEMADVIIRLLDIYAAMRNTGDLIHSLDEVLFTKMEINKERPKLHGNLF
jgi:NTP pyrophosphatase (non-canonical NTP hydrolase)